MKTILLGTSGAWPIPRPGCACDQCSEARIQARYGRMRSGLLLEAGGEVVLVDAGPDVCHQFEREGLVPRVDHLLVTHTHADHCLGLADLVHLRRDGRVPLVVHAAAFHRRRLQEIFPHLAREEGEGPVVFDEWEAGTRLALGGVVLEGFETGHRPGFPTTGVLLHVETPAGEKHIAYATDMGVLPAASRALLRGVDLLVGDGSFLGAPGYGHPGTDAVIALARKLAIARLAFTHFGHVKVSDSELRRRLGPEVGVAYDGGDLLGLLGASGGA